MVASSVVNHIPADRVSQYSSSAPRFYAWFIYDNFNEGIISIEWVYLDDSYSIGTSTSKTGKDFGRGTFTLEAPDDGWPLGKYRVKVSGQGVSEAVDFQVISGATVAVAILLPNGSVDLAGASSSSSTGTSSEASTSTGGNVGTTTIPSTSSASAVSQEYTIFNNHNIGSVSNGPSAHPSFTITQTHVITSVLNYHWNAGNGATPGKISLKHSDGTVYGPWNTTPAYSNGEKDPSAPYNYWLTKPNSAIKAGTYTVIDSDPSTWSYNSSSKNAGFSKVNGYTTSTAPSAGTTASAGTPSSTSSSSFTSSSSSGQKVWHWIDYRYEPYSMDGQNIANRVAGTTGDGGIIYDYSKATGDKYSGFFVNVKRTSNTGSIFNAGTSKETSSTTRTVTSQPPQYFMPGEKPSLTVSHKVTSISSWGANYLGVHFGGNYFRMPDGKAISIPYEGTVTAESKVTTGRKGDTKELVFVVGGYSFIYTYEWLE